VLDILAHQLLTNRSLYASLGLVLAGRLLERSSGWVFAHAHAWASGPSLFWTGWNDLAFVIGWDLLFVFIGFTFMTYATRRLSGVVRGAATPHPYER